MIFPLPLGHVALPANHPRAAEVTCQILAHVIEHPDGVILVDTGCGTGNEVIDALYQPQVIDIVDALANVGIDERSVTAIVNTHLHFDHCGQNHRFPDVPIWTTAEELSTAATVEHYTVPQWAEISEPRLRIAADGEEIANGVRLLATPGHTPGHQSVVVTGFDERPEVIVGQVCYDCTEFAEFKVADGDLHDTTWKAQAASSLLRLRSLRPSSAYLSHDARIYCSP